MQFSCNGPIDSQHCRLKPCVFGVALSIVTWVRLPTRIRRGNRTPPTRMYFFTPYMSCVIESDLYNMQLSGRSIRFIDRYATSYSFHAFQIVKPHAPAS